MNEDTIADLKQFIASVVRTTVREELTETERRLEIKIAAVDAKIDSKADEILAAVAEVMQTHIEHTDTQITDHENRLARLEAKTA